MLDVVQKCDGHQMFAQTYRQNPHKDVWEPNKSEWWELAETLVPGFPHLTRLYCPDCPIWSRRRSPNKKENFDAISNRWVLILVDCAHWCFGLVGLCEVEIEASGSDHKLVFSLSLLVQDCFTWGRLDGLRPIKQLFLMCTFQEKAESRPSHPRSVEV